MEEENPLSGVEDVFNAITVKGNAVGDVMFYGRGAGKRPTASAVVADVMDVAKHRKGPGELSWAPGGEDTVAPADALESRWYVRLAEAAALPEGVQELTHPDAPAGERAFLTGAMSGAQLRESLSGFGRVVLAQRVLD